MNAFESKARFRDICYELSMNKSILCTFVKKNNSGKMYNKLLIFIAIVFLSSACKDKRCDEVVCENNGWCKEGFCVCVNFYEGDSCSIEGRLKFFGTYKGVFKDSKGEQKDTTFILLGEDENALLMNLNNGSLKLVLNGAITANIPEQKLQLSDTLVDIFGNAALLEDSLTVNLNYIENFERISSQFKGVLFVD